MLKTKTLDLSLAWCSDHTIIKSAGDRPSCQAAGDGGVGVPKMQEQEFQQPKSLQSM